MKWADYLIFEQTESYVCSWMVNRDLRCKRTSEITSLENKFDLLFREIAKQLFVLEDIGGIIGC